MASVFAVDDVGRLEEFEGSARQVAEVAERGRDEDQLAFLGVIHVDLSVWLASSVPTNIDTYVKADREAQTTRKEEGQPR